MSRCIDKTILSVSFLQPRYGEMFIFSFIKQWDFQAKKWQCLNEITLLSNGQDIRYYLAGVLLPYEITLLSNQAVHGTDIECRFTTL